MQSRSRHGVSFRPARPIVAAFAAVLVLGGCALAPSTMYSQEQMTQLGDKAYAQIKKKTPESHNASINRYVQCVVSDLAAQTPRKKWNVTVFKSKEANAFALPGGNIGVYTGILKYADTQAELAAVIGHEMGHVLAHHINKRLTRASYTQLGLQAIGAAIGKGNQAVMGALGLGAQYGIILPYSRSQEAQADIIGQRLMAKAGFDPRETIQLWQNMSKMGNEPPEFLSDHPSSSDRIANLRSHMNNAMQDYKAARAAGRHPRCGKS